MAHYTQHLVYHMNLLRKFKEDIQKHPPYQTTLTDLTETDQAVMTTIDELCKSEQYTEEIIKQGQWLIERIISGYNELMHFLPRDLLWFFGGDCLHYMPDDEIHFYQQLDELRFAADSQGRSFNIEEAKKYINQKK